MMFVVWEAGSSEATIVSDVETTENALREAVGQVRATEHLTPRTYSVLPVDEYDVDIFEVSVEMADA